MSTNQPLYPTPLADFMVELFHFYWSQRNDTASPRTAGAPLPSFEIDDNLLEEMHSIAASVVEALGNRCEYSCSLRDKRAHRTS